MIFEKAVDLQDTFGTNHRNGANMGTASGLEIQMQLPFDRLCSGQKFRKSQIYDKFSQYLCQYCNTYEINPAELFVGVFFNEGVLRRDQG